MTTSLFNNYDTVESAAALIDAIYTDMQPENVERDYIVTCVTRFLSILYGTIPLYGFFVGMGVVAYNAFSSLYDRAKLNSMMVSLTGRIAIRVDYLLNN